MAALRIRTTITALTLITVMGCTPTQPTTTPPAPSPTCTPEAGGNPYPCTPYDHDQMIAKDKLYTEAEAVYRAFLTENERIYRAGGVTEPTAALLKTTTGQYLKDQLAMYRQLRASHATATGGSFDIKWFQRVPGQSIGGSAVALRVCRDSHTVSMGAKGVKPHPGLINHETGYFVTTAEGLKITASTYKPVDKC